MSDFDGERRWTIGELARASTTVRTLHHYDEIGLVRPAERTRAGHRRYTEADVRRLYRVRALVRLGLSLDEVSAVGGAGDLTSLLSNGFTYHMGKCDEMRTQLEWMRAHEAHFYGMDLPGSSATALPAVQVALAFLDEVDPAYAAAVRAKLLPLFDYLPADRTGLAWAAPAIQAYLALEPAHRYELTARISELAERLQAMRVVYGQGADVAQRCATNARHLDAFLANMVGGAERTYESANIRDAAMAENVEWILEREDRIVVAAANGHIQRWPFHVPPYVPNELTVLGQYLASSLGERMVVIATTFGGGKLWLHRAAPGQAPGHTEAFVEDIGRPDDLAYVHRVRTAPPVLVSCGPCSQ